MTEPHGDGMRGRSSSALPFPSIVKFAEYDPVILGPHSPLFKRTQSLALQSGTVAPELLHKGIGCLAGSLIGMKGCPPFTLQTSASTSTILGVRPGHLKEYMWGLGHSLYQHIRSNIRNFMHATVTRCGLVQKQVAENALAQVYLPSVCCKFQVYDGARSRIGVMHDGSVDQQPGEIRMELAKGNNGLFAVM